MAGNKSLNKAKDAKLDEFYTQRSDIENELAHYAHHFKDKVVYCNCDDPVESEFWKFFVRNFKPWGLKKLIATHYEPDEKNYSYSLEICEDTNGDGRIDMNDEPTITQLPCNGDFRSAACIELLKEADIVVTNPPFSLFREYMAQLMEYRKKFVIIGSINALKYKDIFPYIKNNQIWMGATMFNGGAAYFMGDPSLYDPAKMSNPKHAYVKDGVFYWRVNGVRWYTNLDIPQRHRPMDFRGNYYKPELYPRYYNFDAIDVSKVEDIPCDYDGLMGVPISLMDKYCPEQFEIIDRGNDVPKTLTHESINGEWIVYKDHDGNVVWKTPYTVAERKAGNSLRLDDNGKPGKLPYDRIIIRLRNPEPRRYPDDN